MGVVSAGFRETFYRVAPPPPLLSLPWPIWSSEALPGFLSALRATTVDLGGVVMPQIWEVTLGDEGVGARQEIGLKPPKGPARPWEVGALEQGRLGPVSLPGEKGPRPTPKSTPSRPDLCNRDPSGPSISRPLKDQRSFPAVSYKRRGDPGALEAAVAHFRLKRA